ncbi:hypothetical protein H5410_057232 [Solanum commersonii]|uniref:Uncharacterized protein n=1 Tax=Solanum commersonii TaxID=4109 RepID=A0A9J5WNH0_SOLCO|nr:hypothetical protein H5410_057232 [Solanum commersonii]
MVHYSLVINSSRGEGVDCGSQLLNWRHLFLEWWSPATCFNQKEQDQELDGLGILGYCCMNSRKEVSDLSEITVGDS